MKLKIFLISLTIGIFVGIYFFVSNLYLPGTSRPAEWAFDDPSVIALAKASVVGDTQTIDDMLKAGADINYLGLENITPLYWHMGMGGDNSTASKQGFRYLLQQGADPLIVEAKSGFTTLHLAARYKDSDYLRIILEEKPDINIDFRMSDSSWDTPLLQSILSNRFENFKLLLNAGADIEAKTTNFERTPLFYAKGNGTWEFAYELLKRGADYSANNTASGRLEIVSTIEGLVYNPDVAIRYRGTDWREKVIEFLRNKGVEVYPWYPEDDPRYNPRPESTNKNKTNDLTDAEKNFQEEIRKRNDDPEIITISSPENRDFKEEYKLTYEQEKLKEATIQSSIVFFDNTYTGFLNYQINKDSSFELKEAFLEPDQLLLNLNTRTPLKNGNLENLSADDIGIIVDDIKLPLNFITRNMNIKEIIKKYGDRSAVEESDN